MGKVIAVALAVLIIIAFAGAFFGFAIMIGAGILASNFGWSATLGWWNSWALGVCWSILQSGTVASNRS